MFLRCWLLTFARPPVKRLEHCYKVWRRHLNQGSALVCLLIGGVYFLSRILFFKSLSPIWVESESEVRMKASQETKGTQGQRPGFGLCGCGLGQKGDGSNRR